MLHIDAKSHAFMEGIKALEINRSVDGLIKLFSPTATLESIAFDEARTGVPAIRAFWQEYVDLFSKIETTFTQVINVNDLAVLEWISKGVLTTGQPVHYRGVTLLEFAGDQIKTFRAYYDSAAFIPDYEKHLNRPLRKIATK